MRRTPPSRSFAVRLDKRVIEALKKAASARDTKPADLVRDAIISAIGICPTCGHDHTRPRRVRSQAAA